LACGALVVEGSSVCSAATFAENAFPVMLDTIMSLITTSSDRTAQVAVANRSRDVQACSKLRSPLPVLRVMQSSILRIGGGQSRRPEARASP